MLISALGEVLVSIEMHPVTQLFRTNTPREQWENQARKTNTKKLSLAFILVLFVNSTVIHYCKNWHYKYRSHPRWYTASPYLLMANYISVTESLCPM